jgi:hypothetical protein
MLYVVCYVLVIIEETCQSLWSLEIGSLHWEAARIWLLPNLGFIPCLSEYIFPAPEA